MCGTARRLHPPNGPVEDLHPGAALVTGTEEKLHADADAEHRPAGRDAVADRVVEPVRLEAPGSTLHVPDPGDDCERRLANLRRIDRDRRLGSCPREGRADRAKIAGAVVGEHDPHAMPFVERMPPSPGATA